MRKGLLVLAQALLCAPVFAGEAIGTRLSITAHCQTVQDSLLVPVTERICPANTADALACIQAWNSVITLHDARHFKVFFDRNGFRPFPVYDYTASERVDVITALDNRCVIDDAGDRRCPGSNGHDIVDRSDGFLRVFSR